MIYPVLLAHRWGFIDRWGRIVVPPTLTHMGYRGEAAWSVAKGRVWSLIDDAGLPLPGRYKYAERMSEGLCFVERKVPQYVNRMGETAFRLRPGDLGLSFSEGLAVLIRRGRFHFVDRHGRKSFGRSFEVASSYSEGLAAVRSGGKWGFIDNTGEFAINPTFGGAVSDGFKSGLAAVRHEGAWGYIDRRGAFVIPPRFRRAGAFHCGRARVQNSRRKTGFIDFSGSYAIEPCYGGVELHRSASDFRWGIAAVCVKGKWGVIDVAGETVLEPRFDGARVMDSDVVEVWQDKRMRYVDRRGTVFWEADRSRKTSTGEAV